MFAKLSPTAKWLRLVDKWEIQSLRLYSYHVDSVALLHGVMLYWIRGESSSVFFVLVINCNQMCENWRSRIPEPRFIYQKWSMNPTLLLICLDPTLRVKTNRLTSRLLVRGQGWTHIGGFFAVDDKEGEISCIILSKC